MSSSKSPVLILEVQSAWRRLLPACALLTAALLLPWLIAWSPVMHTLVTVMGLMLAMIAASQSGMAVAARRITRVAWNQDGDWQLQFAAGEPVAATLSASSWCSPWLMCWRLVDATGRRHGLLLWRPEFSPANWHQWQLRLRLETTHADAPEMEPLR